MTFAFLTPAWLWALLVVPAVWFLPRRVRDVRHGLLRSAVLAMLILGLARPITLGTDEAPRHVVIVDRSASLSQASDATAVTTLQRVLSSLPPDSTRIVVDLSPPSRRFTDKPQLVDELLHIDGTKASNLAGALTLAAAAIPDGSPGAISLVSDGLSTQLAWGRAHAALIARGVPLHTVELAPNLVEPRPVALNFSEPIRAGHTAQARARLIGMAAEVRVVLESGGETLASRDRLVLDGRLDLSLAFEPPAAGFHDIRLRLDVVRGNDVRPDNNTLTRRIAVQRPLRLLYLGHRMQGGGAKLADLLGSGYDLVKPANADDTQVLETIDVVVLDDRPARELTPNWRQAIADAIERGGVGLFASGGRAAFGAGGYHKTEIEDLLPIEFVQKEEKKDPSTTLTIIIDTSGSMVGNRMTLAKQVARLAMRRLQPHDKIGIVEFYGTKTWAAPIQSAANQIDLQRALNRLAAQGGTVLMPAVEEAYYALKNVQTRYKHVLVLTDAGVETGPYEALCRRMSDEGMTVSTVLVGPGRHSDFLVDLADWGGGRYYNATDRFNLPELLLKKPSTSVLPSYRPERVEIETAGGPGWWGDVDPSLLPPLDGYVESELRPGAEALISTAKTGAPLLATKLHGLGRATAFMTEPLGAGTRSWNQWKGYGAFLGRVLARTGRGHQQPFDYTLERRGDEVFLEARKLVRADIEPVCHTVDARGKDMAVLLMREVAPGLHRYRARWPRASAFHVRATTKPNLFAETLLVVAAYADTAPETQVDPAHRFPFVVASGDTAGRHFPAGTTNFDIRATTGTRPLSLTLLWPLFVLLALLFFCLDVFHRRRARPQLEVA